MASRVLFASLITIIFTASIYWFGFLTSDAQRVEVYSGIYRTDGHRHYSSLEPCDSDEGWTLRGNIRRILIEEESINLGFLEPLHVQVEGVLTPKGRYGHMDGFDRELTVTRVVSIGVARDETACSEPKVIDQLIPS